MSVCAHTPVCVLDKFVVSKAFSDATRGPLEFQEVRFCAQAWRFCYVHLEAVSKSVSDCEARHRDLAPTRCLQESPRQRYEHGPHSTFLLVCL